MTAHKWKREITAWANGAELEWRWSFMDTWLLFDHSAIHFFVDYEGKEFRVKRTDHASG